MSAIALTAAQIRPLTSRGAVLAKATAGATITIGQTVYMASTGSLGVGDADASAAASAAIGIAVESFDGETTIASGDPCTYCVFGPVSGFSGMTPGALGWQSDTAGGLDTAAGTFDRIMGYAESATVFFIQPDLANPSSA